MRIYRLLGLLSVLAEVEHITVQELAVRFEVSRRTILRDIDTLNEAGFPVASRPGRGGGVSILKGYRQDKRLLSREDYRQPVYRPGWIKEPCRRWFGFGTAGQTGSGPRD